MVTRLQRKLQVLKGMSATQCCEEFTSGLDLLWLIYLQEHYSVDTHTHTHTLERGCSKIRLLTAQGIPQQTAASHVL